jgi:DNA end-binding protein Ku
VTVAATLWSGAVSFGLVSVPVRMTGATVNRDISFNQLEAATGSRVRMKRVSEASGEELPTDEIVKGYEIAKGRYVVIGAEELDAIRPPSSQTIEITEFVDLTSIDPVYFEHPYYLVPDKQGVKAYRLLVAAMEGLGKAAIGRVVIRNRESLVAIRPVDGALCVEMLRYADEVVPVADLGVPGDEVAVTEKELAMARQLLDALSAPFEPEKYRNDYRDQLLAMIERKAAGEVISAPSAPEPTAKVLDLMAALEQSIAQAKGATDEGKAAKPTRRRPKSA